MKRLTVQPVNANLTYVSGHGSRDLITEVRNGRPPCWSPLGRAWAVHPTTAADAVALAEVRRFEVVVLPEDDPLPTSLGVLF